MSARQGRSSKQPAGCAAKRKPALPAPMGRPEKKNAHLGQASQEALPQAHCLTAEAG